MSNPIISNAKALGIKPLTREQNDALYQRIRQGDTAAINEMIEGNIALVILTVASYLDTNTTFKYLRDDLQSECYLALVDAVNRLQRSELINPLGYLYMAFRNAIETTIWEAGTVSKYVMKQSQNTGMPPVLARQANVNMDKFECEDHTKLINLRYVLQACCADEHDSAIIELREMGYTDFEIGDQINLNQSSVTRRRSAIYARYCEASGLSQT